MCVFRISRVYIYLRVHSRLAAREKLLERVAEGWVNSRGGELANRWCGVSLLARSGQDADFLIYSFLLLV